MHSSWYKNAIIYSLDVETFYDSDNDGTGDFQGLIRKLDYIASLGITCIWLLPFYPSPNRDNGYDVMDYYNVDPRLGTLGDFTEFMHKAQDLGIRVLIDLVVNHTSIEHPWFQQARQDKGSAYRKYYVWADEPMAYKKESLMFKGEEDDIWTYDEVAGQYYLHRFYKEQPDLNISNPEVREEILKIIGFWLELGVSGFRVDAAELLIETYGLDVKAENGLVVVLEEMREYINTHRNEAILVGETNIRPDKMDIYLDEGRRMHMLFNFYVNQHLFLSVASEDPAPLVRALLALPEVHPAHQWLNFLRHHDELSLKLLNRRERQKVYDRFAPDESMRIYGHGIRRRLAPMLRWNMALLQMVHSLLFSLPGIPMIRYGDEIAMGDDLSLPGRASVRTVMQWSGTPNGGFSRAPQEQLVKPVIDGGTCGYKDVNVVSSQRAPDSFFNWLMRLIGIRRQCPEIGLGQMNIIDTQYRNILVHSYTYKDQQVLLLHNFSGTEVSVDKKEIGMEETVLTDIFSREVSNNRNERVELKGYAYKWLRVFR